MMNLDEIYIDIMRLIKEAGSMIRERTYKSREANLKSCDIDLVTEWDQKVEKLIIDGISSKYFDHKFIGEEGVGGTKIQLTETPTWIIDPIDGTMNFVHGMPHSCISVALVVNKITEIGIVYNPFIEQLFTARRGKGAFLNGGPIKVSTEKELAKALVMIEFGTSRDPAKMDAVLKNVTHLTPLVHGIRCLGSAALNGCMVALGAAEIYYEFGIHCWDIAALDLIVREAGGVTIDPAGGPFDLMSRRVLCASSMELAQKIAKELTQFYPECD